MGRAVTRAVSIAAPRPLVFAVVADPTTLPRYAPGFAKSVTPDGDAWIAETARGALRLEALLDAGAGTVDLRLTAADGGESTVFTRVVPNGAQSEFVFTLLLPDSASDTAVAEQGAIVEQELTLLKALCEGAWHSKL
ncbi:SRPBCC family protein [Amycolatopsis sp. H20-H5]|uniref:SRPBCC family protein n=1 Tax=Amycolatopsis sp. H20-H5 TaxID=3046309 RepID=UPI002DB9E2AD|nr:SRPBCC family protein [Amycolatopsis sp. H20-H5]MEC3979171.1 SRPBCC family protein [Amycolatopsis sp. H20-H5]